MANKVISSLEELAAAVKKGEPVKVRQALLAAGSAVREAKPQASGEKAVPLDQLEKELSVWAAKIDVILKESPGREGMAKHAFYWIERLSFKGF